jgi:hypothetical protein
MDSHIDDKPWQGYSVLRMTLKFAIASQDPQGLAEYSKTLPPQNVSHYHVAVTKSNKIALHVFGFSASIRTR